jgi:hypothetical protein
MASRICPSCEKGILIPIARAGRLMPHRNLHEVPIPADFEIPTCNKCGAEIVGYALATRLDAVLEGEWQAELAKKAAVNVGRLQAARPLREWERLVGVSPGYLSKLKGGKAPAAPLTALLELLANAPSRALEIERLWGWPAGFSDSMLQHYSAVVKPPQLVPQPTRVERMGFTVSMRTGDRKAA